MIDESYDPNVLARKLFAGVCMDDKGYYAWALVMAARYIVAEYDKEDLPDWVFALANGNPYLWNDLRVEVMLEYVSNTNKLEEVKDECGGGKL